MRRLLRKLSLGPYLNISPSLPFSVQSCYICEERGMETQATYGACMACHKSSCRLAFHVTWWVSAKVTFDPVSSEPITSWMCGKLTFACQWDSLKGLLWVHVPLSGTWSVISMNFKDIPFIESRPHPQATPRFYLTAVEKTWYFLQLRFLYSC